MKTDKQTLTHKKYIQLEKRWNKILWEMYKKEWIPLKQPYQDGWTLYYGLREDAMRRKDAPLMLEALSLIRWERTTKDPKIVSKIRSNPTLEAVKKLFPIKTHMFNNFYEYDFSGTAKFIDKKKYDSLSEDIRKYFYCSIHTEPARWGMQEKKIERYYITIPSYYIIVKVKKRMVTHIQNINPALMKEKEELNKLLEPYWRTCPQNYRYDDYWYDIKNPKPHRTHWRTIEAKIKTSEIEEPEDYKKFKPLK